MFACYVHHVVWPQWGETRQPIHPGKDSSLLAMVPLAEKHDSETSAHIHRVRHYSRTLALELASNSVYQSEMDDEFLEHIGPASLLHDIGKAAIPAKILLKPGQLTPDEYAIIKTHTTAGAQMLDEAMGDSIESQLLAMARSIAVAHHEKFDGTGYPYGLRGEEIPLCARIVALADVYDALTSKRVYKAAYSHGVARSMIVAQSGKHFDPAIVSAFLSVERIFETTCLQFAGQYSMAG